MIASREDPVGEGERLSRLVFDTVAVNVLRQVLEIAHQANALLAPVKGVVLSRWLYEQISDRPYRDLDLLVSRDDFSRIGAAIATRGWPIQQQSMEMGDLEFTVDRIVVEIHAEFGRRDLSRLTTDDVLRRARPDTSSLPVEVMRIDDVDHFFLLVANVTKKAFTYANRHQPADLERLLSRLAPRRSELIHRARDAGFSTALRNTTAWMIEEHQSEQFRRLSLELPAPARRTLSAAVHLHRLSARRQPERLKSASGLLGLVLATLTPDDRVRQVRGLARLVRRGIIRRLGRHPG